jgi:hypothetical protein
MPKGRPNGWLIHTEAFEALLLTKGILKKDVAAGAGVSPTFIGDLLAHRAGAHKSKAESIATQLSVPVGAIFPEAVGWVSPLPDRGGSRDGKRRGTPVAV